MKSINVYLLLVVCYSCNSHTASEKQVSVTLDTLSLLKVEELRFSYDNTDTLSFGVKFVPHDFPIGQPSLVLNKGNVYIIDAFHSNVKKVDLNTGKFETSQVLPSRGGHLYDAIVFNNKLYISSELDTIYVLDMDLAPLARLNPGLGRASFVRTYGNDSLSIYFPDAKMYQTWNHRNELIRSRTINLNDRRFELYFKNKWLKSIGDGLTRSQYGVIRTNRDLFLDDVDFDSTRLVVMDQDSSYLTLSVFHFDRPD